MAIQNQAIADSTAIWSDEPVDLDAVQAWYQARMLKRYPVLIAEARGEIIGYASFGDWHVRSGYRFTVEHSIYVWPGAQRRGVGSALLAELIERADRAGKHAMIGAIEADNISSVKLHERYGFVQVGKLPEVGMKFGRWLDLILMQRPIWSKGALSAGK